jgi:hypothetical protein
MALSFTTALRNTLLDTIETTIGTTARLRIYSGAVPSVNSAPTGTLLVNMLIPTTNTDWMANASNGSKAKANQWSVAAEATGPATYFRILNNAGTTWYIQGPIADLGLGSTNITSGGIVTINTFTLTAGNL